MMKLLALLLLVIGLVAAEALPALPAESTDARPAEQPSAGTGSPAKSPGRAVLLSLLIPGGGQVYTGHWWKTLLIAPAELALAGLSVRDHRAAVRARNEGDEERYLELRDRRNTLLFFTGTVLAYSMADAWISARMYRFDREMEFSAGPGRAGVRVGF